MEPPICVTDAQTFVEHIHQIKTWVYNGQLRLVIPSGFSENVDALYKKSLEAKSIPKEDPKTKVFGRAPKKEHPVFDANPKAAREYLARIQAGKNYETGSNGRAIYEDIEKHDAVHIAKASEQYSAWKELEDYEEKPEVPAGSESWADKLRRKQVVLNEQNENILKGPVKPKLVAKTGADHSPWKVQKTAPTISGVEVPVPLRPMMSFGLWRIHESIHRNDEVQVFVLTSGSAIKVVAQKLNVDVRSPIELSKIVEAGRQAEDLNSFGRLEEEFGARPVKERHVIKCTAFKGNPPNPPASTISNGVSKDPAATETPKSDEHISAKPRPQWTRQSSALGNAFNKNSDSGLRKAQSSTSLRKGDAPNTPSAQRSTVNGLMDKIRQISGSGSKAQVSQKQPDGSTKLPDRVTRANEPVRAAPLPVIDSLSAESKVSKDHPARNIEDPAPTPNAWSRSWAEMLSGERGRKPSLVTDDKSAAAPTLQETPVTPLPTESKSAQDTSNVSMETAMIENVASAEAEPKTPSIADAASSSLDSDEEIVVFKPKQNRLSAQKKPVNQTSRPTTPKSQSQSAPVVDGEPLQSQTPKIANHEVKRQATPKATPRQRHTPKQLNDANGIRHSPRPAAPVIDPDAFGRDFAVNTHANKGSIRGSRVRHSPQPSLFDSGVNPSRPTSSHRQHRRSPSRVSPRPSPPQNAKVSVESLAPPVEVQSQQTPPTSAPRGPSSSQRRQLPIGFGRPSVSPAQDSPPQRVVTMSPLASFSPPLSLPTLNANAPVFQPGGLSNPLLQAAFQPEFGTPKSTPPVQPPIGSGRPSSKTSQLNNIEPIGTPISPVADPVNTVPKPAEAVPAPIRDLEVVPPKGPRNSDPNFSRRPTYPRQNIPQVPLSTPETDQAPIAPLSTNRFNNRPPPFRNGDFPRGRGGRPGVSVRRPVKPVLFEPDLDHTRAFQPDVVEPKKTVQADVQYVLKSGSTRAEARGKGRLWVG